MAMHHRWHANRRWETGAFRESCLLVQALAPWYDEVSLLCLRLHLDKDDGSTTVVRTGCLRHMQKRSFPQ